MRRMLLLFMVAVILVIVSAASAVAQTGEFTKPKGPPDPEEKDLPKSGGLAPSSVLLPAGAALLGMGLLGYAVIRRR